MTKPETPEALNAKNATMLARASLRTIANCNIPAEARGGERRRRDQATGLYNGADSGTVGGLEVPMDSDIARRLAFQQLLAQPDPPEMHRGNVARLEGKPDRHEVLPLLAVAFAREKLMELRRRVATRA